MPADPTVSWQEHFERERARYDDGEARLPRATDSDDRQRQLTRIGTAAGGSGLALLVLRRDAEAAPLAESLRGRDDFPRDVADALAAIAAGDSHAYAPAIESVLRSGGGHGDRAPGACRAPRPRRGA